MVLAAFTESVLAAAGDDRIVTILYFKIELIYKNSICMVTLGCILAATGERRIITTLYIKIKII